MLRPFPRDVVGLATSVRALLGQASQHRGCVGPERFGAGEADERVLGGHGHAIRMVAAEGGVRRVASTADLSRSRVCVVGRRGEAIDMAVVEGGSHRVASTTDFGHSHVGVR
jgi:hypothetical protein